MSNYLAKLMSGRPTAVARPLAATNPTLARLLQQMQMEAGGMGSPPGYSHSSGDDIGESALLSGEAGMLDDLAPREADPMEAFLGNPNLAAMLEPRGPSLAAMFNQNDAARGRLDARLANLTPEQLQSSIPAVGRQFEAERNAARAAEIREARELETAAKIAAAGLVGGGALYGTGSRLAEEALVGDEIELPPDLSGDPAAYDLSPGTDIEVEGMLPEVEGEEPDLSYMASPMVGMFDEDQQGLLGDDEPGTAPFLLSQGPDAPVVEEQNMEDLPGPQLRSVKALIRAGIAPSRAMDIITGGASMSPDEYRQVTGGRR
jgi:hypothetical protein